MEIQKIIKQLIHNHIINSEPMEYKQLNGGTVSELYLLNMGDCKYVVKSNAPQIIKSEASFLYHYRNSPLLPKLLFVENSYKYIVYSFIVGSTNYDRENKKEMLKQLVQGLQNHYKSVPKDVGWGWADQPQDSWQSFLLDEIMAAKDIIHSRFDYHHHDFLLTIAQNMNNESKPYLLHGDCGVHNFIFNNGQLNGVIDPTPVIGDPLFDLIYAFCSSPDDLTKETIDSAASHLTNKHEISHSFLYKNVLIGLYLRLGACIKHHPHDFEEYYKAWNYWCNQLQKMH
ncbi:phosphotransferase [Neobacillus kokaensis]|uniref:Aminoglycoside phosphotransferase n=1 Tax=Neobacillus kokaensis TaxID=2759023 RepID=A0ABQ3N5X6_9BACI|nr:phosphotransferase [Neobacillus kokaensis]GHI00335.1 aminoglycoside phosphotransferase [Neobacillus kokaensis]